MSLKEKAKILLHPIFEKFRKEYAVPHSLIIDDYEHDITNAVLKVLEDAEKEINEKSDGYAKVCARLHEQVIDLTLKDKELKQKLQTLKVAIDLEHTHPHPEFWKGWNKAIEKVEELLKEAKP